MILKLGSADARFAEFRLWKDANANGVVDEGEVLTLAAAGVTDISLAVEDPDADEDWRDGAILGEGSFAKSGGGTGALAEVGLAWRGRGRRGASLIGGESQDGEETQDGGNGTAAERLAGLIERLKAEGSPSARLIERLESLLDGDGPLLERIADKLERRLGSTAAGAEQGAHQDADTAASRQRPDAASLAFDLLERMRNRSGTIADTFERLYQAGDEAGGTQEAAGAGLTGESRSWPSARLDSIRQHAGALVDAAASFGAVGGADFAQRLEDRLEQRGLGLTGHHSFGSRDD